MKHAEIKAMMAEIAPVIREFTAAELAPVLARIAAIESRAPQNGKDGRDGIDGKDGAPGANGNDGVPGRDGADGKDGRDGKDAEPITAEQISEAVLSIPNALDEAVQRYLAANPPAAGKDGRDGIDGKDGAPGQDGERGVPGKDGRDGADAIDVIIDRDGHAIFTLSDGRTKDVGQVVGRDGKDGRDGECGVAGKDGHDGIGFDDLDFHVSDEGAFLRFVRGEEVKAFRLPIVMDRGVYSTEKTYRAGDGVTWGGSFWIAQEETAEKPDGGKGWRLAVKRGRDGKDGVVKAEQPVKVKV